MIGVPEKGQKWGVLRSWSVLGSFTVKIGGVTTHNMIGEKNTYEIRTICTIWSFKRPNRANRAESIT